MVTLFTTVPSVDEGAVVHGSDCTCHLPLTKPQSALTMLAAEVPGTRWDPADQIYASTAHGKYMSLALSAHDMLTSEEAISDRCKDSLTM